MKRAVIFAGGEEQYIASLSTPKPLILVYGKPLIAHQLERLVEAGFTHVSLIVGEHKVAIEYVVSQINDLSLDVEYIQLTDEDATLIDAFRVLSDVVKEACVVLSCDTIFEHNPFVFLKQSSDIEILVHPTLSFMDFCGARIQAKIGLMGDVQSVGYDVSNANVWFTGIYFFSERGLAMLNDVLNEGAFSTVAELFALFAERDQLNPSKMSEMVWFDINSPDTLMRAEMFLRRMSDTDVPVDVALHNLEPIDKTLFFDHQYSKRTHVQFEAGLVKRIASFALMDPKATSAQHIVITDENVDAICGDGVYQQLLEAGYRVHKFIVPDREAAKTMKVYSELAEKIISLGIDEQSIIFAVGGGAVANISGFLASTLYRGIGLIHVPTTMLSMLDVSISLKQGINGQTGKNLVGSLHQPLMVLIDPAIEMPDFRVQDGLSEGIKHAICQDSEFFDYLLGYDGPLSDVAFRSHAIRRTIELKVALMDKDIYEYHEGMILNYGHEVGHAIELLSRYEYTHGQAIAIGMCVASRLSRIMDVADDACVRLHTEIFKHYGLPTVIPQNISRDAIMNALVFNKKNRNRELRMVLPEYIGKVWKIKGEYALPCPVELIEKAIDQSYE